MVLFFFDSDSFVLLRLGLDLALPALRLLRFVRIFIEPAGVFVTFTLVVEGTIQLSQLVAVVPLSGFIVPDHCHLTVFLFNVRSLIHVEGQIYRLHDLKLRRLVFGVRRCVAQYRLIVAYADRIFLLRLQLHNLLLGFLLELALDPFHFVRRLLVLIQPARFTAHTGRYVDRAWISDVISLKYVRVPLLLIDHVSHLNLLSEVLN